VVVLSSGGTLLSLDPSTGDERWRSRPVADGVDLSVGTDVFVVGGRAGRVAAVDPASGDLRWTWTTESALASVATGTDQRVGMTYALDARGVVHVLTPEGRRRRRFRVAERVADRCGWNPQFDRATAVTLDRESLYVTGPFVARIETRDP
jgi:outer membrane protein assembly factor BamB